MSRKKILKFGLATFVILSVIFTCAVFAAEMYLKDKHEHYKKSRTINTHILCTKKSDNPVLIYSYVPNVCEFNSKGFRDREHFIEKPEESFRVVVIGDSVASGLGVEKEEVFGRVLERMLEQSSTGGQYEVIILAVNGYSTTQELELLNTEAFAYQPDLIVWSYVLNDPAHPIYHNANGELGKYYYMPSSYLLHTLRGRIFRLKENQARIGCEQEWHQRLHCVYWDSVESSLAEIGAISKKMNIPIIFLIHPYFEKIKKLNAHSLKGLPQRLAKAAKERGLIPIDLIESYLNYPSEEFRRIKGEKFDPWHPNARGHFVGAETLFNKIRPKMITQRAVTPS